MIRMLEKPARVPLSDWNAIQKDDWLMLVAKHMVDKNDITLFFKFGTFFNDYYERHGEYPSFTDIMEFVRNTLRERHMIKILEKDPGEAAKEKDILNLKATIIDLEMKLDQTDDDESKQKIKDKIKDIRDDISSKQADKKFKSLIDIK